MEKKDLILKNEEMADIFNEYFGSVVENLNIEQWKESSIYPSVSNS